MPEKITILKDGGESINSNIVSVFMIPESGKKYIITTENAVDPHGLTVLHVSEIKGDTLVKIETDEEWSSIKTIMRAIISSSVGSYQYIPSFSQANASGQYSRDISVSGPASKQMIDSYTNGDKIDPTVTVEEPVEAQPSDSIFPTAPVSTGDNEVVPGIAVEENPVTIEATPASVDPNAVPATTPEAPAQVEQPVVATSQPVVETAAVPPVNQAPEAVAQEPVVGEPSLAELPAVPVHPEVAAAPVAPVAPDVSATPVVSVAPVASEVSLASAVPEAPVAPAIPQADVNQITNESVPQAQVPLQNTVAPVGQPVVENNAAILTPENNLGQSPEVPVAPIAEALNAVEGAQIPGQGLNQVNEAVLNPILSATVPDISAVPQGLQQAVSTAPVNNMQNVALEPAIVDATQNINQNEALADAVPTPDVVGVDPFPTIPVIENGNLANNMLNPNVVVDNNMQQLSMPQSVMVGQQVAQPVGPTPLQKLGININFDAQPDMSSKATLDEVVAGAQELFQEGVKNLIMVMTERIYKDLKAKEEDLKRREIIVAQREQAINDTTMNMMSSSYNQGMMRQPMMQQQMMSQGVPQQPMYQPQMMPQQAPVQPMMMQQPMVQQPTVVQVPNDANH